MEVKKTNAVILAKIYDILLWIIPQLDKFPRSQKFFLGNRIENLLLDVLEQIIEAVYTKEKKFQLYKANVNLEKLRFLIRREYVNRRQREEFILVITC